MTPQCWPSVRLSNDSDVFLCFPSSLFLSLCFSQCFNIIPPPPLRFTFLSLLYWLASLPPSFYGCVNPTLLWLYLLTSLSLCTPTISDSFFLCCIFVLYIQSRCLPFFSSNSLSFSHPPSFSFTLLSSPSLSEVYFNSAPPSLSPLSVSPNLFRLLEIDYPRLLLVRIWAVTGSPPGPLSQL